MFAVARLPTLGFPNPLDWADWGKDLVGGVIKGLAEQVSDAQLFMLKLSIKLIARHVTPSLKTIQSDWFTYLQGAWLAEAFKLMYLVILIAGLLALLSPKRNHSDKIMRTSTSAIYLIVFMVGFYSFYGLAVALSHGFSDAISHAMIDRNTNRNFVEALTIIIRPDLGMGLLASSGIGIIGCFFLVVVVIALYLLTLATVTLYPIAIVLRVAKIGDRFFHASNGVLVTVISAPPIMVFWLCLSYFGTKQAGAILPGGEVFIGVLMQLGGYVFAAATPLIIFGFAYRMSTEIIGNVESSVQGDIDISAKQPLNVKEQQDDVRSNQSSIVRDVVVPAAIATIDDKPGESVGTRLADIAGTVGMTTGHPGAAAAAEVVKVRLRNKTAKEKGEST